MVDACNRSTQKDNKINIILGCMVNLRAVWVTKDPVTKSYGWTNGWSCGLLIGRAYGLR